LKAKNFKLSLKQSNLHKIAEDLMKTGTEIKRSSHHNHDVKAVEYF